MSIPPHHTETLPRPTEYCEQP